MSNPSSCSEEPTLHRYLYDGCKTDQEMADIMMAEIAKLQQTDDGNDMQQKKTTTTDDHSLDFAAKTSQWIAYERSVESSLPANGNKALFHDPLAQYMVGSYGRRMSDAFALGLQYTIFDPPTTPNDHNDDDDNDDKTKTERNEQPKLGLDGHLIYTATRTKLIDDYLENLAIRRGRR